MKEPPNSRYFLPPRSGQPMVWITRSSGFATFQTSFTASSHTCGSSPRRSNRSSATPVRWPCVPSASTVTFATRSEPASKLPSSPPSRFRPLSPVRTPTTRPCETRSFSAVVSGRIIAPPSSACSAEEAAELARARRSSSRGCASAAAAGSGAPTGGSARRPTPRGPGRTTGGPASGSGRRRVGASALGFTTAPERRCEPGCLPFSSTATGTSPSRSASSGLLLDQLAEPDRAGEAGRPGADDEDADLDPLVRRIRRLRDVVRASRTAAGSCSAGSSLAGVDQLGQLGHDLVHVADHAEVAELEDRRVRVLVDRDDRAGALHPDLVLDCAGDAEGDVELR